MHYLLDNIHIWCIIEGSTKVENSLHSIKPYSTYKSGIVTLLLLTATKLHKSLRRQHSSSLVLAQFISRILYLGLRERALVAYAMLYLLQGHIILSLPSTAQKDKRELTPKQEKFLDELMVNGGHVKNAVAAAGYKEQSRSWLTRSLRDEIIDRTRNMLATNSVKAASRIVEGLDADGTTPLNQMDHRLKTAETILEANVMHGIIMLPSKDKQKEIIIDQEEEV